MEQSQYSPVSTEYIVERAAHVDELIINGLPSFQRRQLVAIRDRLMERWNYALVSWDAAEKLVELSQSLW